MVIDDADVKKKDNVKRLIFTSGKVYYDLSAEKNKSENEKIAIIRIEQLYPFPKTDLRKIRESYSNLSEIYFVQEEPKNMGMWNFVQPKLTEIFDGKDIKYIGRDESPSPASGSSKLHSIKQQAIIKEALE